MASNAPAPPLILFSLPVGLKEMMDRAISLAEYTTFSSLMRLMVRQVRMRRAYLEGSEARREARDARQPPLRTADESTVRTLWAELSQRLDAHLEPTMPPPLLALLRQEAEADVPLLNGCLRRGDAPPADEEQKAELFRLCAAALSRCGRVATPQHTVVIMAELGRLREAVLAGATGGVALVHDALRSAHGLLDEVEQTIEGMMAQAEAKAQAYRQAFAASF